MKILAISGALRKDSFNTQLLKAVRELAPPEMAIEIVTLHGVPLYDGDEEDRHGVPASVKALQAKVKDADGVII
jgi:NAD(P)H-dependent FMN reductase